MNEEKTCLRCGGSNLEPGSLRSTGRVSFRPKRAKFLSSKFADIHVEADICIDCGHIDFVGDAKKTESLLKAPSHEAVCPASLS